jgi:polysaccharide pyruvyl transferase WcaK-like protein
MIKRSTVLEKISEIIKSYEDNIGTEAAAEAILRALETVMDPKVRPLTEAEVEDHILVKQVHESRKPEVRNYVRNLDYEWKREYLPEDT